MKHTPGDWYMNMYYHEDESRHFGVFVAGKQIVHLAEPTFQEPDWATDQENNAHLIAAAPELLKVCKALISNAVWDGKTREFGSQNEYTVNRAVIEAAKRVVSRVEGRDEK